MSIRWESDLHFEELDARVDVGAIAGLRLGMEHIGAVSAPLVPVEDGTLVHSQQIGVDEAKQLGWISYGTPYARFQHDRYDLRHEHGQANYLGQPVHTEKDAAVAEVGDGIKKAI